MAGKSVFAFNGFEAARAGGVEGASAGDEFGDEVVFLGENPGPRSEEDREGIPFEGGIGAEATSGISGGEF